MAKKKRWEPYTLVHVGTYDPVLPTDCNEHADEGMLVYRSKSAANIAAKHQMSLWTLKCRAVKLSAVIEHEFNVAGKLFADKSKDDARTTIANKIGVMP